jgi:hypothetical protein
MPTTTATYAVVDTDQILVDVVVGDGQPGGSTVYLGQVQKGQGGDALRDVDVGSGSDVVGKKLIVTSEVTDRSPDTDNTSVQVAVRGGSIPKTITQSQVATKNDIVSYVTVVSFTGSSGS